MVYWHGLKGGFIFDDMPNLQDMGTYGELNSWDKIKTFISSGIAGPTGRPLSLLSFLIDANTWPADPYPFKYTNLMLHVLNGLLLSWSCILILTEYAYDKQKALWIGLVATAIWMLHPYMVSTTLYVVQRMAQLATLFTLVGIIGYLKGRNLLIYKPICAYAVMSSAIGIATILATYSKENGALLPMLILVIEFCNPNKLNKPNWKWRAVFLWLPSITITFILLRYVNFSSAPFANRNFNMMERLYSEARIVCEYLYNLFIPQIELKGLFQDGFNVSRALTRPITTLSSIVFLCILLFSAFYYRKKYPLYAVAILFFFASHLMESTVIGLELYFEHRNYTAALFLFLPIAALLYYLKSRINTKLVDLITLCIFAILAFFSYQRANLWANPNQLQIYWAQNNPESARAQNAVATILYNQGYREDAKIYLQKSIQKLPDSTLLNFNLLLQKVYDNSATHQDYLATTERFKHQPLDAQALMALRYLVDTIVSDPIKLEKYGHDTLALITSVDQNSSYHNLSVFSRLKPYLEARIYLAQKNPDQALQSYLIAVQVYNNIESNMLMVAEFGSAHYPNQTLVLLDKVELLYKKQAPSTLHRSKSQYDMEIKRIKQLLINQIEHS